MDLLVGHVKWLGTLETQVFYSKRSSAEVSMEEQGAGRSWMIHSVGRSPVVEV